ncbi:MAG: hypothetical protein ACRED0_04635 [Gammaproteobacteria bacterium]
MTPIIDEAKRLLRIAGRDYETFTILHNHLKLRWRQPVFMPSKP